MDSEIPNDERAREAGNPVTPSSRKRPVERVKPRKWSDSMRPRTSDPLEFFATTVYDGLAIAFEQVTLATGMDIEHRAKLLAKLAASLANAMPKRRLWEAEQVIKGDAAQMATGPSPKMESRNVDVADQSDNGGAVSRPAPRRGRPRT